MFSVRNMVSLSITRKSVLVFHASINRRIFILSRKSTLKMAEFDILGSLQLNLPGRQAGNYQIFSLFSLAPVQLPSLIPISVSDDLLHPSFLPTPITSKSHISPTNFLPMHALVSAPQTCRYSLGTH